MDSHQTAEGAIHVATEVTAQSSASSSADTGSTGTVSFGIASKSCDEGELSKVHLDGP
jgi:hypothetical protein